MFNKKTFSIENFFLNNNIFFQKTKKLQTQSVTKLKISNCDNSKPQNVITQKIILKLLQNSNSNKTQELKFKL